MLPVSDPIRVCFVCLGNICRSPLAEGVFLEVVERRGLASRLQVDSCGTSGWHVGEGPDRRSVAVARKHGIDIRGQRSRSLVQSDYTRFDWLVAMDRSNERDLRAAAPPDATARIVRMMSYVSSDPSGDVPDPYYGGDNGFEHVYGLLAEGSPALLDEILDGS